MRIALISDLHCDINQAYPVIETVAEIAAKQEADALFVAGDISETYTQTMQEIKKLQTLCDFPVWYVPGNHDLWNKNCPEKSTEDIYLAFREDPMCLTGQHMILEKAGKRLAVTGDVGWFDYGFAASEFSGKMLDTMSTDGRTWQDRYFNDWCQDNPQKCRMMLDTLEHQLKACGDLSILVVTHMLPVDDFCVPAGTYRTNWGFFNAFLGTPALETLYKQYPVRYAVCGHVHYRKTVERDGIRYVCPCLGYYSEWPLYKLRDESIVTQVSDSMQILTVE